MNDQEILQRAVTAFETVTGLHTRLDTLAKPAALLDIAIEGRILRFATLIKTIDRFQTIGAIATKTDGAEYPDLLVAPYITAETAEQCRALKLPFIDTVGNAYIETAGLFVFVTGKPRPHRALATPAYRALTPAGLKIIFALLNHPPLSAAPYREIAKLARVALGTIGEALADLQQRGHLTPEKPGPRRLLAPGRLTEEWAAHYPVKLRPKLNARRYTAPTADWWQNADIRQHRACWGGEIAAAKLTGILKPARITIYTHGKPDQLILGQRLRPDANGEIEILETFWTLDETRQPNDVAPPLLVYADLMATTDARNIETAKLIRDQYLVHAHDTV